jgi:ERCC4-type nuclease
MGNPALPNVKITICVDSREQKPWVFSSPVVAATLSVGDYSIMGCSEWICVERKSLPDLIMCLSQERNRFTRELQAGARIKDFTVIVEGKYSDILQGNYRSEMNPKSAWESFLAMQQRYSIPFFFAENREIAAKLCESILLRWWKEHLKVFETVMAATAKHGSGGL